MGGRVGGGVDRGGVGLGAHSSRQPVQKNK